MTEATAKTLLDFVRRTLLTDPHHPLTTASRLRSEGLIDSLGVALLAAFIEERFGTRFDDVEIRAGRLETVDAISAEIARRR
jgi:acyl carrier protein